MLRLALALLLSGPVSGHAQERIGLGYVLDQPLPVLAGVSDADFTETVGIGAQWVAFDNDRALVQALLAQDVAVAVGVGPQAFLDGISAGIDLRLIDIAAELPGQADCVLRSDIAESGAALHGLRVALPYGSIAELAFEAQISALGAEANSMIRRDLAPADAAAALARGDTEIACGSGADLARMRDHGVDLTDPGALFALGQRGFSAVVVTAGFAARQPGVIEQFLLAQSGLSGDLAAIASASDIGVIDAEAALAAQRRLSSADKLGGDWFGGGLPAYLTALARLRAERNRFAGDPASVAAHVDASFLAATGR